MITNNWQFLKLDHSPSNVRKTRNHISIFDIYTVLKYAHLNLSLDIVITVCKDGKLEHFNLSELEVRNSGQMLCKMSKKCNFWIWSGQTITLIPTLFIAYSMSFGWFAGFNET